MGDAVQRSLVSFFAKLRFVKRAALFFVFAALPPPTPGKRRFNSLFHSVFPKAPVPKTHSVFDIVPCPHAVAVQLAASELLEPLGPTPPAAVWTSGASPHNAPAASASPTPSVFVFPSASPVGRSQPGVGLDDAGGVTPAPPTPSFACTFVSWAVVRRRSATGLGLRWLVDPSMDGPGSDCSPLAPVAGAAVSDPLSGVWPVDSPKRTAPGVPTAPGMAHSGKRPQSVTLASALPQAPGASSLVRRRLLSSAVGSWLTADGYRLPNLMSLYAPHDGAVSVSYIAARAVVASSLVLRQYRGAVPASASAGRPRYVCAPSPPLTSMLAAADARFHVGRHLV
jgi:hypothetical protein